MVCWSRSATMWYVSEYMYAVARCDHEQRRATGYRTGVGIARCSICKRPEFEMHMSWPWSRYRQRQQHDLLKHLHLHPTGRCKHLNVIWKRPARPNSFTCLLTYTWINLSGWMCSNPLSLYTHLLAVGCPLPI